MRTSMSTPRTSSLLALSLGLIAGCTDRNDTGDTFPWEVGCIEVEGVQGKFNFLSDAVEYGGDAPVITLCNGFSPVLETVAINKPTVIIGGGGGRSVISAPINEPLMQVASGVTLTMEGVKMQSTRNAIEVYEDAVVDLTDVTFDGVENWGIEARDATITIRDSNFDDVGGGGAGYGGIYMNGGTLDVSGTTFNRSHQWGIRGEERAQITLTENVFQATTFVGDGSLLNGFGVSLSSLSEATLSDNVFSGNVIGGLHLETGGVVLTNDRFDGDYVSIWAENPSQLKATGVRVHNASRYGAALISAQTVDFTDVEITADPELVGVDDLTTEDTDEGSFGVIAVDATVAWAGGKIEGYNSVGMRLVTQLSTGSSLTASDLSFVNNGRLGLQTIIAEVDLTNVTIESTRADSEYCQANGNITCDMGAWLQESSVTWTGGNILNNEGWGALVYNSSLNLSEVTLANSGLDALYVVDGAVVTNDVTFDGAGQQGIFALASAITVKNSTFQNGKFWSYSEATLIETSGAGVDIAAYSDSTVVVADSVFVNGDTAIDIVQSNATVENTTFTDYRRRAVDALLVDKLTLRDVEFLDSGPYAVTGSSVDALLLEDVTVKDSIPWTYERRTLDELGNIVNSTVEYRHGPAFSLSTCNTILEDVTLDNLDDTAIVATGSPLEIDNLTVRGTGTSSTELSYAVEAIFGTGQVAELVVDDLTVTGVANGGAASFLAVRSTSTTPRPVGDLAEFSQVSIGTDVFGVSGVAGNGLALSGFVDGLLDGVRIENVGGDGLLLTDTHIAVTGTTELFDGGIHTTGGAGLAVKGQADSALVSELTIENTTGPGILLDNAAASLTGLSVEGSASEGVKAAGASSALTALDLTLGTLGTDALSFVGGNHSLTRVSSDTAGGWGMTCAGDTETDPVVEPPVFALCDTVEVDGVEGEHQGCEACLAP